MLWDALETKYGAPGVTAIYLGFKAALDLKIPDKTDPSPLIDKMLAHFGQLAECKVVIPDYLQAMILIAKFPPSMEALAQHACQEANCQKLKVTEIRRAMSLSWEQTSSRRKSKQNQNQAKKISAVKHRPNKPSFQQQQGESSGSGQGQGKNKKRGNCAGRNRGRGQGGFENQQARPATEQQQPAPPPPAPTQPAPPQFQFGHIASPAIQRGNLLSAHSFQAPAMFQSCPPLIKRIAPQEPPKLVWPSFSAAHSLAKDLGVTPTVQTVKILESAELARTSDPRPKAKKRKIQEINNDEVIDLGWSEDDIDVFMEGSAGPSGTTHRFVATHYHLLCSTDDNHTAIKYQQTNYPPSFTLSVQKGIKVEDSLDTNTQITMIFPSCHEIENEIPIETEWMLDSGASSHFTFNINDFVEYELIEPVDIQTANSHTSMVGKGTVLFIMEEEIIRIYPVLYIPDLNQRILSMGQFLQSGMLTVGTSKVISILEKDQTVFLNFHPRRQGHTIYTIKSLLGIGNHQNTIQTIYQVDYEILHQRMAHPSDEVMRHANKFVKGFLVLILQKRIISALDVLKERCLISQFLHPPKEQQSLLS